MSTTFDVKVIVPFDMFGKHYEVGFIFKQGSLEHTLRKQLMYQGKIAWV